MSNKNENQKLDKININWYPGHMAKAKREIINMLPVIDIIYELIDARIPYSSKMNNINQIIGQKQRILIMTKKDLCDINETNKWIKYYEKEGYHVLLINLNDQNDYKKIIELTKELLNKIQEKRINKGLKEKEVKALVIGIPNVGKSTFINKLAGKKIANVGNNPGITKQNTWLNTKYNLLILDTPGVLEPKLDNELVGLNLAAMSAIKIEILPINDVAYHILTMLNKYYPNILHDKYGLDKLSDDVEEDYEIISNKLNIKSNNGIDYNRINNYIINDIKLEHIKNITFDRGI